MHADFQPLHRRREAISPAVGNRLIRIQIHCNLLVLPALLGCRLIDMDAAARKTTPDFENLPGITFRQLEVFSMVCRERSYANAAVERRTTRANIKRVMKDFEEAVGRPLFVEKAGQDLELTPFGQGLLSQVAPLARSLRRLGDGVRALHEAGRILRFAAPADFFKGGKFSGFLDKLHLADGFRPCFLKIDVKRFRTALLNAECDVYFGVGLAEPERLDCVDFGPVPWAVIRHPDAPQNFPANPAALTAAKWSIGEIGEAGSAELLAAFRNAGAKGGEIISEAAWREKVADPVRLTPGEILLIPDTEGISRDTLPAATFPAYHFTAVMRRNHPYAELQTRLKAAAVEGGNGGH
jgi:DNA-binding transcriptional LysR family regulator